MSDWPHTAEPGDKPDDAQLFERLAEWVPDERARARILVDNATELYDFPRGCGRLRPDPRCVFGDSGASSKCRHAAAEHARGGAA